MDSIVQRRNGAVYLTDRMENAVLKRLGSYDGKTPFADLLKIVLDMKNAKVKQISEDQTDRLQELRTQIVALTNYENITVALLIKLLNTIV